jgi:D-alanyl-D-alanine carboxypeptidase
MRRPRVVPLAVAALLAGSATPASAVPTAPGSTALPLRTVLRTATAQAVADGYPAALAYARRGARSAAAATCTTTIWRTTTSPCSARPTTGPPAR